MICQFCAKFVSTSLSKLVQEIQISFLFGFVLIINYSGSNHFSFISFHRKPNGWDLMQNSQNTLLKSDLATLFALGSLLLDWSWCVSPSHSGSWPLVTNCNWLAPCVTNQLSRCFINPSTASLSTERIKPKLVGNRNQSISCYLWHLSVAANGKLTTLLNVRLLLRQSSKRRILHMFCFI